MSKRGPKEDPDRVVTMRLMMPAPIHRRLKVEAAKQETTIHEMVLTLLDKHLPKVS